MEQISNISNLAAHRANRATAVSIMQRLEDKSEILPMEKVIEMLRKILSENEERKLVSSVISNNTITDARKSIFFQAMHGLTNEFDYSIVSPYLALAAYYGLLDNRRNDSVGIATAQIIRKGFVNKINLATFDEETMEKLGQPPFHLTGSMRTEIKTKIHTAVNTYVDKKDSRFSEL